MSQPYASSGATTAPDGDLSTPQPRRPTEIGSSSDGRLRDRVHWGPVWAGVLVALPVFLVLQLLLFSFGALDLGVQGAGQGTVSSIVSAVLALIAFFVGGVMAGSSATSHDSDEGALHGVVTWAVGVVAILGFSALGAGALLGDLATAASQFGGAAQAAGPVGSQIDPAQALSTAHQAAGWAALALGLTVAASAAGGLVGQTLRRRS